MKAVIGFKRLEMGIVYLLAVCKAYLFVMVLSDYLERTFILDLIHVMDSILKLVIVCPSTALQSIYFLDFIETKTH